MSTARDSKFLYNRIGAALASGTTKYVELLVENDGSIGCQIAWTDAVTAATFTLEATSFGITEAPTDAAAAHFWKDTGVAIAGPALAIGSTLVNVTTLRQKRARLKIVTTAISKIQVLAP